MTLLHAPSSEFTSPSHTAATRQSHLKAGAEPTALAPSAQTSEQAPPPNRKQLRQWLSPFSQRNTKLAIRLLLLDYALFLTALPATLLLHDWWSKLIASLLTGFMIGRLFIIGHDACHQSLTPHRKLNHWLGRIAFLPSLTPYSLWEVGHNVVHHGYTNLKGFDFVWAPLTKNEFKALSFSNRWLYRIYRSGWAPGLYYLVEIWWKRMFFPNKKHMPTRRAIFYKDCSITAGAGVLWLASLLLIAQASEQSIALTLLMGFFIPFLFWVWMIGFVVYVHHTHQSVVWHHDKTQWANTQPFVSTTVHLTFPLKVGALLHHIMEHTAHHVDMSVPLYNLKAAQTKLEQMLPVNRIVVQPFSFRWYRETAKRCKLYDFEQQKWQPF